MKKWKKFEKKTAQTIKNFNSKSEVYQNVYITGKFSKSPRQIDVKLVDPDGYDFMIFECKDKTHSVDTPVIEAFITKLKDLGDKKGAIVSNSQFTKGAQNMAKAFNVDLLNLVDSSDEHIRTTIYAPVLLSDIIPKTFNVGLKVTTTQRISLKDDVRKLTLVNSRGENVTAYQVFVNLWNNTKELSKVPGSYIYTVPEEKNIFILSVAGDKVVIDNLHFNYEVIEKHYLGNVKLINTSGLYNVKEKSYTTKSLETENIIPYEVEKIWKEIENSGDAKGKYSFGMQVISLYSEEESKA